MHSQKRGNSQERLRRENRNAARIDAFRQSRNSPQISHNFHSYVICEAPNSIGDVEGVYCSGGNWGLVGGNKKKKKYNSWEIGAQVITCAATFFFVSITTNNNNKEHLPYEMSTISEFLELVRALYQLGQEVPQYLLFLSELAEPNLNEDRTHILGRLFEEVPQLLSNVTPLDFHKLITNVPQSAVTMRMLVNLHKISTIFQQMSCLQILHLTNNLIPPGPLNLQVEILLTAQEHMKQWSFEKVTYLHDEIGKTSLQFERKRLLELEPRLPWELLQFFAEILKLPSNELVEFFKWFIVLDHDRINVLVQLLQLEPIIILEFKRRLTLPSSVINNQPSPVPTTPPIPEPSPLGIDTFLGEDVPLPVFDPFAVNILFNIVTFVCV